MGPQKIYNLSAPVMEIYSEIENQMLVNIAKQLKGTTELLSTDPAAWQLQRMQNMGILDKANIRVIRDNAGLASKEINKLILNAGLDGLDVNDKVLKNALKKGAKLIEPPPISQSPKMLQIMDAYQRQAKNTLNLTNQTLIDKSKTVYKDILNRSAADVITGNLTGEKALRKTVRAFSEKGIPALVDRSGKTWGAEGYVRTVLMSTSNNVVNEMQMARYEEWGNDFIEISSHGGDRPGCVPYAGRIFSTNPDNKRYPYLYDSSIGEIGEPHSLFGINCGHVSYPYIEGVSQQRNYPNESKKENAKVYEESQKQRQIERGIRKAKTQLRMFEAMDDKVGIAESKALISSRQSSMRSFIKDTGRTRRNVREQIY